VPGVAPDRERKGLIDQKKEAEMPARGDREGPSATQQSPEMTATFLERVWAWVHRTFPERQIYIRSDGRVQFFTFSPSLQATLAGLTLIFLGWVAFATVNVVFKDRIIAAKDHRYQQMQAAYENRVADLQISYDELNGALVAAGDRFKATADALQAKQNAITGFLNRAQQVDALAGGNPAPQPAPGAPARALPPGTSLSYTTDGSTGDASQLTMMPGPAAAQPRTARPRKSSFLDGAVKHVAALFQTIAAPFRGHRRAVDAPVLYARHPALRGLDAQTERLARIGQDETRLMARTETALDQGIGHLRSRMRHAGIDPDQFAQRIADGEGVGGPEIPLDRVHIAGISDPGFTRAYLSAAAVLDQLNSLSAAMDHVPLAPPVAAAGFDESSGFGARVDPFTHRYAFHSGIDFAGPWGSVVHATAPGTVVFAGFRGGYGNMVEIDHGYGIHTRYGHLSAISVRLGAHVDMGAGIGRVGSTGRSTGAHVHYEVWYDNAVKDPNNFIEAGRHVL
jgi:murein DD-endopeptidase MepM/ murein hydrolase activator NlpD